VRFDFKPPSTTEIIETFNGVFYLLALNDTVNGMPYERTLIEISSELKDNV